ncbi:MAG: 3'-5' exonuclease [Anaerolineae bacterium]|jgi:DNA polymerase III epsilon subunit-like protein|nr:3'-5' exonuclease [Anaerolineae bacterium]
MAHVAHPGIQSEAYISVDVETSGPNPGDYDLLSIGACRVDDRDQGFYVELQPVKGNAIPGSLAISGLSMQVLAQTGVAPARAMVQFEAWLHDVVPGSQRPVFVALNAPFDWMFVNDYFHRYLQRNPFGHSALDIKAFYMGFAGVPWAQTSMRVFGARYLGGRKLTHNALQDARDQAEVFAHILEEVRARRG